MPQWFGNQSDPYRSFPDRRSSLLSQTPQSAPGIWRGPLRTKKGFFSTFLHTHDPRAENANVQRKIISFDFDAVCRWGGLFGLFTRASVLRISTSLCLCLFGTVLLTVGTAVVVSWYCDETHMDITAMDSLQQRINIMVTFMLGFFVQLNVSRWWNHREFIRAMHGALADVLVIMASSSCQQVHLLNLARYGLLAQALTFEETRGAFANEAHAVGLSAPAGDEASPVGTGDLGPYTGLIRLGLLKTEEVQYLAGREQKAQLVWVWIANYALELQAKDKHGDHGHHIAAAKIQKRCCLGRGAVSAIKSQLGTQLPFTYVQLIAMLVQCSHVVMAVGCGYTAAAAWGTHKYALLTAQIVQSFLIPMIFQSLLDVCVCINDPFGSDILDFSFLQYHVALLKTCESLASPLPTSLWNFAEIEASAQAPPKTAATHE